jgi:HlyD family secretion protein
MKRALGVALCVALAACRRDGNGVSGTGTLEVVEVDVAPLTPARVLKVFREEGDSVGMGDTLVSLTQSTTHADVEARRGRLAAAEAQLRELVAGALPTEIQRSAAEVRATDAEATRTARDLERVNELVQSGSMSRQQQDAARSAATAAAAKRDAAREALRFLQQGTRPERVAAARAEVETARAALDAAMRTASDLVLTAPTSGTVLLRNVEAGETIAAGTPAMTLGDLSKPYVRIFVNQQALSRVRLGAIAEGVLDGIPNRRFTGEVVAINAKAEFTPRVALTEEERADLLFGVKIAFRDLSGILKPGLPITVSISQARAGDVNRDSARGRPLR